MPEAVLILTFGPVQPFIREARRAADLYVGSQILVRLAGAAARAITKPGALIFPAQISGDVPNRIVARVPTAEAQLVVRQAEEAFAEEWERITKGARAELARLLPSWGIDTTWDTIWQRQVGVVNRSNGQAPPLAGSIWELYWAAATIGAGGYPDAYRTASQAVDAVKRTRVFEQSLEQGVKDSLSGRRAALRTAPLDARAYWGQVSQVVGNARVRPAGRERLDALGATKRFSDLATGARFPSVGNIAAADFLAALAGSAALREYRETVETFFGVRETRLDTVSVGRDWPYDGLLLYPEGLTPDRLEEAYGLRIERGDRDLRDVLDALEKLQHAAERKPSPYYAIIAFDGDSMGERISRLLEAAAPEDAHRGLSQSLAEFAEQVPSLVHAAHGTLVYNGGDDVLALAPLATALSFAQQLATKFATVTGGTGSAGIAINHYRYPLDAALRSAREAEALAKQVPGKAAVCLQVRKHSGQSVTFRSTWNALGDRFQRVVDLLQSDELAARFPYGVLRASYALPTASPTLTSELRRLLGRHGSGSGFDPATLANDLNRWTETLGDGTAELGNWLTFARFVAQGGRE